MDAWLAGFADGEGCFTIDITSRAAKVCLDINLRMDDVDTLKALQQEFGGYLRYRGVSPSRKAQLPGAKPSYCWTVTSRKDILNIIEYFDKYPLRTKKKYEYAVWREAALLYYRFSKGQEGGNIGNPQWLVDAMAEYKEELQRLKKYNEQPQDLSIEPPEDPQLSLLGEAVDKAIGEKR